MSTRNLPNVTIVDQKRGLLHDKKEFAAQWFAEDSAWCQTLQWSQHFQRGSYVAKLGIEFKGAIELSWRYGFIGSGEVVSEEQSSVCDKLEQWE